MNQVNRIRIFDCEVPHKRFYALSRRVAESKVTRGAFTQPLDEKGFKQHLNYQKSYVFAQTKAAVNKLLGCEGIYSVDVEEYGLTITLPRAFDFADVEASILTILRDTFFEGETRKLVVVQDCTTTGGQTAAEKL